MVGRGQPGPPGGVGKCCRVALRSSYRARLVIAESVFHMPNRTHVLQLPKKETVPRGQDLG